MLYREIIAVCSQIHTEHINTVCVGQKNVKILLLQIVNTVLPVWQTAQCTVSRCCPEQTVRLEQESDLAVTERPGRWDFKTHYKVSSSQNKPVGETTKEDSPPLSLSLFCVPWMGCVQICRETKIIPKEKLNFLQRLRWMLPTESIK